MPTREETYQAAASIVQQALDHYGSNVANAWLGIYEALLWYESADDGQQFPHIIDANRLKGSRGTIWQRRAKDFEEYLAGHMGCQPQQVKYRVDKLLRLPPFQGLQRQNPLGIAFIGIMKHVLRAFGDSSLRYEAEMSAKVLFPTIDLPGRSKEPKIDLAVFRHDTLVAIISTKWSVRHDRLGDLIAECRAYKGASVWTHKFAYYVVTNEFDVARLAKMLADECFGGVVHVCKDAVTSACGLDGQLIRLLDLRDLVSATRSW